MLQVFPLRHGKNVAGCRITEGQVSRANSFRVLREEREIFCGSCGSLKREKADVELVDKGLDCGVLLNGFDDCRPGDVLQCYRVSLVAPPLPQALRV